MAIFTEVVDITAPTSTGTVAYTLSQSFDPSILLFFSNTLGGTTGADWNAMIGVGISSSDRRVASAYSQDNLTTTDCSRLDDDTKCIRIANATPTTLKAADFVSHTTGTFSLNWTTANATSTIHVYALAIGGSDITNVASGVATTPTTATTKDVVVGFQPDLFGAFYAEDTTTAPPSSTNGNARIRFGVATSSSTQWCNSFRSQDALADSRTGKYQRTDKIFATIDVEGGDPTHIIRNQASVSTIGTANTTLNWDTVSGDARQFFWFAIKGGVHSIGAFNQATSNGNQTVTVAQTPAGVLLTSYNAASGTAILDDNEVSVGVGNSATSRASLWAGDNDGAAVTQADSETDTTKIIEMISAGGTPTTNTSADLSSLNSGNFVINNSTTDATARQILYWAIGSAVTSVTVIARRLLGVGL